MTKKDFEAIAHVLDANCAPLPLVEDFANLLEETNPRFDRIRFIKAATGNLSAYLSSEARFLAKAIKE